jgi:hypothetical protein
MRWLKGIAALLMLVLMMPLAHACVMASHSVKAQHECCQHDEVAVQCGDMSSNACCAMQAPGDTTLYSIQSVLPLVLPSTTVAVVYDNRDTDLKSQRIARDLPAQHSPRGIVIASTIVLRI